VGILNPKIDPSTPEKRENVVLAQKKKKETGQKKKTKGKKIALTEDGIWKRGEVALLPSSPKIGESTERETKNGN